MKLIKEKKGKELVKRNEIKDSPFMVITTKGKSFGVFGKFKITEDYKTQEEVKKELTKINWNRIIQVIMLMIESNEDFNNIKNK